jgi:hypothetical protein
MTARWFFLAAAAVAVFATIPAAQAGGWHNDGPRWHGRHHGAPHWQGGPPRHHWRPHAYYPPPVYYAPPIYYAPPRRYHYPPPAIYFGFGGR